MDSLRKGNGVTEMDTRNQHNEKQMPYLNFYFWKSDELGIFVQYEDHSKLFVSNLQLLFISTHRCLPYEGIPAFWEQKIKICALTKSLLWQVLKHHQVCSPLIAFFNTDNTNKMKTTHPIFTILFLKVLLLGCSIRYDNQLMGFINLKYWPDSLTVQRTSDDKESKQPQLVDAEYHFGWIMQHTPGNILISKQNIKQDSAFKLDYTT